MRVSPEKLQDIARRFGDRAEVIADFSKHLPADELTSGKEEILDMLRRRPCSLQDICDGLGLNRSVAQKLIGSLLDDSLILPEDKKQITYYKTR